MSYGENLGTSTLARQLKILAEQIYYDLDDGRPYEKMREDAKRLMQGAMELWERMMDE